MADNILIPDVPGAEQWGSAEDQSIQLQQWGFLEHQGQTQPCPGDQLQGAPVSSHTTNCNYTTPHHTTPHHTTPHHTTPHTHTHTHTHTRTHTHKAANREVGIILREVLQCVVQLGQQCCSAQTRDQRRIHRHNISYYTHYTGSPTNVCLCLYPYHCN